MRATSAPAGGNAGRRALFGVRSRTRDACRPFRTKGAVPLEEGFFLQGLRMSPSEFLSHAIPSLSSEMAKKSKKAAPEEEAPKKKGKKKAAAKK